MGHTQDYRPEDQVLLPCVAKCQEGFMLSKFIKLCKSHEVSHIGDVTELSYLINKQVILCLNQTKPNRQH